MVVAATLGMFIVDLFEFPPDKPQVSPKIGGGGLYTINGARMFLQPEEVGMIVDRGSDWDQEWQRQLDMVGPCWIFRDDETRLTTKAKATYDGETRGFEYLVPRIRLSPGDLAPTRAARPDYLHFVCSPTRALEIVGELDTLGWTDTKLVYEPIPFCCIPSELPALRQVLPRIHYFSPNHEEAGTFYSLRVEELSDEAKFKEIERLAQVFLDEGAMNTVIVRSGRAGAYVKQRKGNASTEEGVWIPAYYSLSDKVVDVTGAGNAFLGGLIAGLSREDGNVEKACLHGAVASSFTIEQYALPQLGSDGLWNNDSPMTRVEEMQICLHDTLVLLLPKSADMRPLTEEETKTLFGKLAKYVGPNLVHLIDRPNDPYCFRLHKDRVYYVSEAIMKQATSIARPNLAMLGTCLGKFSKTRKFRLHITSLDWLSKYAKYKVWIKPNGEMPYLYGNHVVKAHLGRITEDTPEHQGVVIFSMNDTPLGFGVTAKSSVDSRKLDPTGILVYNQADIGEYLRDENELF